MRRLFLGLLAFLALGAMALAQDDSIGAGKAPAGEPGAREQALAEALRDAVRKGAGVDVYAETKVGNFTLEYDSILTASCGYIEDYKIVSQKVEDGFYAVEVKAKVGKGIPQMDKILALRNLVRRKGSPRVLVVCRQEISGVEASSTALKTALEELALKTGFEIVDAGTMASANERSASRDELLGREGLAEAKRAGVSSNYDFIIKATASGSVGPLEEEYEVKSRDVSIGLDMAATWADTGETVASVSIAPATAHCKDFYDPVTMPDQLARKYMLKMLNGESPSAMERNGLTLFRRIVAKWITELDLGTKMKLELVGIDKASLDKLLDFLKSTDGIAYVWIREFDSQIASSVEVESRIDAARLGDIVLKQLGKGFALDRQTKNSLHFIPVKTGVAALVSTVAGETPQPDIPLKKKGGRLMAWTIIGAVLMVAIAFIAAFAIAVSLIFYKKFRAAGQEGKGRGLE